jgi:hypothetical protein
MAVTSQLCDSSTATGFRIIRVGADRDYMNAAA